MKYRLDFCFKAESYHRFKSFKKHRQINTLFFLTTTALTLSHRPVFQEAPFFNAQCLDTSAQGRVRFKKMKTQKLLKGDMGRKQPNIFPLPAGCSQARGAANASGIRGNARKRWVFWLRCLIPRNTHSAQTQAKATAICSEKCSVTLSDPFLAHPLPKGHEFSQFSYFNHKEPHEAAGLGIGCTDTVAA